MKWSQIKGKVLMGVVATTLLFAPLSQAVQAEEVRPRTMKFSFGPPKDHPLGQGAQIFADLVKEKSDGKMKVALFPNAVLGGNHQNLAGARGGTIDITTLVTGDLMGLVKEYMLFDLPFLFNNEQEALALADGPIGQQLMAQLEDRGLVGLGMWDLGFRHLTNNRHPVTKLEDIAGLKVRAIQSPIYLDLFTALGANPVPLAFPELYGALEVKAVDSQENPLGLVLTNKFYEVQKHLTLTRHTYTAMPLLMSKKVWDNLNETERGIIREAAQEAGEAQRRLSIQQSQDALKELRGHMEVVELDDAEFGRLRDRVAPMVEKYEAQIGPDFVKSAREELVRIRTQQPQQ